MMAMPMAMLCRLAAAQDPAAHHGPPSGHRPSDDHFGPPAPMGRPPFELHQPDFSISNLVSSQKDPEYGSPAVRPSLAMLGSGAPADVVTIELDIKHIISVDQRHGTIRVEGIEKMVW